MRKTIIMTALALSVSSAAFADRHGHGGGGARVEVRDHRSWGGGVSVSRPAYGHHEAREWRGEGRHFENHGYYNRRPIYVQRPVIHHRYYDYRYRPEVIVENYSPMNGYYWVGGQWQWDGYEWIWQQGHYEPDPNYTGAYYDGY